MGLQDLVITPIYLILIYGIALILKPRVTNEKTRRFFLTGLSLKICGAIFLGVIYQFYYEGGDTFNYYYWGSKWIWEAFLDSPELGFQIIFSNSQIYNPEIYPYTSRMVFYGGGGADFISRLAGFFAIFTFNTYSTIAVLYAVLSFLGAWWLFTAVSQAYPRLTKTFGFVIFLLPSVIIWGSGLLKDTLMLSVVSLIFGSLIRMFYLDGKIVTNVFLIGVALWITTQVKVYISLCLFPAIIFFVYSAYVGKIKSQVLKIMIAPFLVSLVFVFSYLGIDSISQTNSKYALSNITKTAEATAWWHGQVSEEVGGAGYTFGDKDYSVQGIVRKIIPAINVTLFRPYPWEANSVFMLLSAAESVFFLLFTVWVIFKKWRVLSDVFRNPIVLGMLLFSITFAFAIGAVTYNFGALVRYKVPMMPLYLISIIIIGTREELKLFSSK